MKPIKGILLSAGILFSLASCKRSVEFEYSGTILESCDTGAPMANVEVVYEGDWQEFRTTTDENGRFRIAGKYKTEGCTMCKEENPRLWISDMTGRDPVFAFFNPSDYHVDLGVMPLDRLEKVILNVRFETDSTVSRSGDTLRVYAINPQTLESEEFTYSGPFLDDQVLDTLYFKLPPHIGYTEYMDIDVRFSSNSANSSYWVRVRDMYGAPNPDCGEIIEMDIEIRE